jgi:hypothetical protein
LPASVQDELLAHAAVLGEIGPALGRPRVDTLKRSRHTSMKELRFNAAGGVWRVAFAFDAARRAVLLAAGDKKGVQQGRFYRTLIARADARFDARTGARPR